MNGDHRGADQADRVLGHRPDHFLTPLAANQFGFALLVSHGTLKESLDLFRKDVKESPEEREPALAIGAQIGEGRTATMVRPLT
jgi:hypothetical protein